MVRAEAMERYCLWQKVAACFGGPVFDDQPRVLKWAQEFQGSLLGDRQLLGAGGSEEVRAAAHQDAAAGTEGAAGGRPEYPHRPDVEGRPKGTESAVEGLCSASGRELSERVRAMVRRGAPWCAVVRPEKPANR